MTNEKNQKSFLFQLEDTHDKITQKCIDLGIKVHFRKAVSK